MIRETKTYILRLMSGMLMLLLLLTACSSGDDTLNDNPVLKIYVYSPDHPIVTRADNPDPDVDPIGRESEIKTLQVWVFKHLEPNNQNYGTSKAIGYISTNGAEISSETNQGTLVMNITDPDFIKNKPKVDVYVAANVTNNNCGFTLDESSTRQNLIDAKIGENYFGVKSVNTVVKAVPDDGLPMSGVLKNQPVFGTAPIFGVGTEGNLAKVKLVRAVSKMHFVFCCINDGITHKVKSISLEGTKMSKEEYLFLDGEYSATGGPTGGPGYRYKIGSYLGSGDKNLFNKNDFNKAIEISHMESNGKDPSSYEWTNQTGQDYEDLIAEGIAAGDLKELKETNGTNLSTYYFRESDRQVEGKITYYDGNTSAKTATFKISNQLEFLPGDFGRNHTWIVYAYFNYAKGLEVVTVKVKDWEATDPETHEAYNW